MAEVIVLKGDEARRAVHDILSSVQNSGNSVSYPTMLGYAGYFRDTNGEGRNVYSAFDNSSGDCWCEDFKTAEGAEKWCHGQMSADDVREMESNVEEIIITKESFADSISEGRRLPVNGDYPPYVKFDENGEMAIDMQFNDGYAFDTNPHGLGTHDRIALYYPTVAEVARDSDLQLMIEDYTCRLWAEGSRQEQIYDIAITLGKAGRIHCPEERFDAAVKAIVERTTDSSAKAFSTEQREMVLLAAACNGELLYTKGCFSEVFYDSLFSHAMKEMQDVEKEWRDDTRLELKELADGKVREEFHGLRR